MLLPESSSSALLSIIVLLEALAPASATRASLAGLAAPLVHASAPTLVETYAKGELAPTPIGIPHAILQLVWGLAASNINPC